MFLLRLISVWHYGSLFFTTGGDALVIYPVWKAVHHLPVYEWPLKFPFALALYNYLFYYSYAIFLRFVGADGADIMKWGSMLTPAFAIAGAIAQWKLIQDTLHLRGLRSLLSLLFALGLWLSTSMIRQWAFTIRPDLAAVALVMIALCLVVNNPRFGFAIAGVLFYLAWSFKQSVVLAFAGVCLFLLLHKRWRDLSMLVAVFAALTAATLFLGTPEYRYNILVAPTVVKEFSFMHAFPIGTRSAIANAYWILAPVVLLLAARARRIDNTVRLLITIFVVSLAGGLVALAKVGAYDNYLFEAFAAGSTLLQLAVFTAPGWITTSLVLFGCALPVVQLATRPCGVQPHRFGTLGIATPAEYAEAVALRDRLAAMKKPIFTTNELFSLPWFSAGDHAPALVVDHIYHDATRNLCENGCVEGLLQRGEIPTVMLLSSGDPYQSSLNPKYVKVGEAHYSGREWSLWSLSPLAPAPIK
ncbi:MAG: hypothetical protein WCA21_11650 [Terracidiphilus sp.]